MDVIFEILLFGFFIVVLMIPFVLLFVAVIRFESRRMATQHQLLSKSSGLSLMTIERFAQWRLPKLSNPAGTLTVYSKPGNTYVHNPGKPRFRSLETVIEAKLNREFEQVKIFQRRGAHQNSILGVDSCIKIEGNEADFALLLQSELGSALAAWAGSNRGLFGNMGYFEISGKCAKFTLPAITNKKLRLEAERAIVVLKVLQSLPT